MSFPTGRALTGLAAALPLALLAGAGPADASDRATPPLTPEPPAYYSCTTNGVGTYCTGQVVQPYGPDPTGLFCGSGSSAFEVLDQATRVIDQERWYDRDGDLVRRKRVITFRDATLSSPAGTSVGYVQRDIERITFPVPGDESVAVDAVNTSLRITVPGRGAVLLEKGRVVTGPSNGDVTITGRHDVVDYLDGDAGALAGLCAALGA